MNQNSKVRLPMPHSWEDGLADLNIQEQIYGHRFTQDQEPYMIVLETLAVCANIPLGTEIADEKQHEDISYELPHRKHMRFLLFQDTQMDAIAKDPNLSDDQKWKKWKAHLMGNYPTNEDKETEFKYLDENFKYSFSSAYQAITLLKSMTLDVTNNRRWTSQFLSVMGPDMICTDMRKKEPWSSDRRFFARGGELVYLMLNRSSVVADLKELIGKRFLDAGNEFNKIAKALCKKETEPSETDSKKRKQPYKSNAKIGYLPYHKHEAYNRLGEDWKSILSLNGLPAGHHFEPIFRITALNLLTYFGEQAHNEIDAPKKEPIIADFMDGSDTQFARYSKGNLSWHRELANRAVKSYIDNQLAGSPDWELATKKGKIEDAKTIINEEFKVNESALVGDSINDLIDKVVKIGQTRKKNNAHDFLLPLIKNSGIADYRPGIGTWFNINDDMIFALVLSNVTKDTELHLFLQKLYKRYGLVIGPNEAEDAFVRPRVNNLKFESNLTSFESRLSLLSLAKRHSDDCAFVINPYK